MTVASQRRELVLPTYPRFDVTFVDGEGCTLVADDGTRYLDFAAGIAVVGLGHRHPAPAAAAHAQLDRLWHTSNLYWTEPMLELAGKLSERFGGSQAFFCNSGAEAIEAAVKYARRATGRPGIVALEGSFHGRTMGALSVTGQPAKQAGFGPLVPGVSFARPNDVESLEAAVSPGGDTALILMETVIGEGGVLPLEPAYLESAAEIAAEVGALLCLDEIQCGVGRTGTFFAFEQAGVRPAAGRRSPRGSRTGCRSARCSSPTRRPGASSRGRTRPRSAATPSRARLHAPSATRSPTSSSSTCERSATGSPRASLRFPVSSRSAASG